MTPPAPSPPPPEGRLFDAATREAVSTHGRDSHARWVACSEEAGAAAWRAALEVGFALCGESGLGLRQGFCNERWGQHAGALAHLLTLALFHREGFAVTSEPDLGGQTPDLLVEKDGARLLVEVRAVTGCGLDPWEAPAASVTPRARRSGDESSRREPHLPLPARRPGESAAAHAKRVRAAGRRRAAERSKAEAALEQDLAASVARALDRKAATYAELCAELELPYVIVLYQDADTQITDHALTWALGRGRRGGAMDGPMDDSGGGAFHEDADRVDHVSGLVVLRRLDGHRPLALTGEVIENPDALRPLGGADLLPHLAWARLDETGRVRWEPENPPPVVLGA